jgi:hypothetical protein
MSVRWPVNTVIWLVPTRYWEEGENPIQCEVLEQPEPDPLHLYVHHEEYGHAVYVPAERCFATKDAAIQAAALLTQLKDLKFNDETDWLLDRIHHRQNYQFGNRMTDGSLPPTFKPLRPRLGSIVYPQHQIDRGNCIGYSGDCVKTETIFWDPYQAKNHAALDRKDAQGNSCPLGVVDVLITPLEILHDGS